MEEINHHRRRFLGAAALGAAATAGAFSVFSEHLSAAGVSQPSNQGNAAMAATEADAIRDLRRRILATKWPERETVSDQSQGVQFAMRAPATDSDAT